MSKRAPLHPKVLIGCGAGFSGDRVDAPLPVVQHLIESGLPGFLMLETLGERTLALAQKARRDNPGAGYEPLLDELVAPVLKLCLDTGIPIIGNFGAANPQAAAARIQEIACETGARVPRVAVVEGDDLRDRLDRILLMPWEGTPADFQLPKTRIVAANAYLGALPIAEALDAGADVVVTGRVADPALALGPLVHALGWSMQDWDLMAIGTMTGHLLECGGQICGGYFADPGMKDVPDPARLGFPVAEVDVDGGVVITKAARTGGCVTLQTVREQLLYEVHDPEAYITPDVTVDLSTAEIQSVGENRIALTGVRGRPAPDSLKVTVSLDGGWLGEAEISYAGPGAQDRARLAISILKERLVIRGLELRTRFDLIGVASVFDSDSGDLQRDDTGSAPADLRVRMAVEGSAKRQVEAATQEVLAMLCCGPAGGGGLRRHHVERIHTVSYLVPKTDVETTVFFV